MVDPVEKFLRHFMRKTGRLRTLRELEKDWSSDCSERKRFSKVKLSFAIQKPPERVKTKNGVGKKLKKHETKEEKVKIPPEFLKIAKKFGLPEVHLEFFYENREKFHWERIESSRLHCTESPCSFTTNASKGALVEHMISAHDYKKIACDQLDCSFVAYSEKSLTLHKRAFHGAGRRPTANERFRCKFPSCNQASSTSTGIKFHESTHENKLTRCSYCPYRAVQSHLMTYHMYKHFNIKKYECEECGQCFNRPDRLIQHKQYTHQKDQGFECIHCGSIFDTLIKQRTHGKTCEERFKHLAR